MEILCQTVNGSVKSFHLKGPKSFFPSTSLPVGLVNLNHADFISVLYLF